MSDEKKDIEETVEYYQKLYEQHGHSPKTLGWDKQKQYLRFGVLMSEFVNLESPRVLDVGCGFGDLNHYLKDVFTDYTYTGIDITPELIETAKNIYSGEDNIDFILGDFVSHSFDSNFDVIIASGTFNSKFSSGRNMEFIENSIKKAISIADEGIAFDFLSDKVDYEYEHTFHSSPEEILSIAYSQSRNLILFNNYMPFEFSVIIFKNDSFSKNNTVFERPVRFRNKEI